MLSMRCNLSADCVDYIQRYRFYLFVGLHVGDAKIVAAWSREQLVDESEEVCVFSDLDTIECQEVRSECRDIEGPLFRDEVVDDNI